MFKNTSKPQKKFEKSRKQELQGKNESSFSHVKIFVKVLDENGMIAEDKCGWLSFDGNNHPKLIFEMSLSKAFPLKGKGHGTWEEWKDLIGEDHENWILSPRFLNLSVDNQC